MFEITMEEIRVFQDHFLTFKQYIQIVFFALVTTQYEGHCPVDVKTKGQPQGMPVHFPK